MKTYYYPDTKYVTDFYGSESPVCVDYSELERLARGWETDINELMEQVHEASDAEILEHGTYDSDSAYIILETNRTGDTPYDSFSGVFTNKMAAISEATRIYAHLSPMEKNTRSVVVAAVDIYDKTDPEKILETALEHGYSIEWENGGCEKC